MNNAIIKTTSFGTLQFHNPKGNQIWGWDYFPKPNRELTSQEEEEVQNIFSSLKNEGYAFVDDED